jgi:hypothetical protein
MRFISRDVDDRPRPGPGAGLTPRAGFCQTVLLYWLRELKKEVTE